MPEIQITERKRQTNPPLSIFASNRPQTHNEGRKTQALRGTDSSSGIPVVKKTATA